MKKGGTVGSGHNAAGDSSDLDVEGHEQGRILHKGVIHTRSPGVSVFLILWEGIF